MYSVLALLTRLTSIGSYHLVIDKDIYDPIKFSFLYLKLHKYERKP